jgi:SAM-dependent methyltransferase
MALKFDHINAIRAAELEQVLPLLRPGMRILELGSGSGRQALELQRLGHEVEAVDLPSSNYAAERLFPITDYDGRTLPYADGVFDLVFSSNVLEHVADLAGMHREIRRVLAPGGECIHILPTTAWRFWTTLSAFPTALRELASARSGSQLSRAIRHAGRAVLQKPHGERGNVVSEFWYFRPGWWRRHFQANGFEIVSDRPVRIFYTGEMLFGLELDVGTRRRLSRYLGSSTHLFRLRPKAQDGRSPPS